MFLEDKQATIKLAQDLAKNAKMGDIFLLKGGLGVGKSYFARAFVNSFYDKPIEVLSPTFTLMQIYEIPEGEIWHCDFYRIEKQIDALELGIEDALYNAITLIEWPDVIEGILPKRYTQITLDYGEQEGTRTVEVIKST